MAKSDPPFSQEAIRAILEVAEDEGAPRAWLRIYGPSMAARALYKLKRAGWKLVRETNGPHGA